MYFSACSALISKQADILDVQPQAGSQQTHMHRVMRNLYAPTLPKWIWLLSVWSCVESTIHVPVTKEDSAARLKIIKDSLQKRGFAQLCSPCGGYEPSRENITSLNPPSQSRRFRIVGGKKSSPHSRPWMAFVQILETNRCAGSLINRRFVLTAAHCVCTHFFCGEKGQDGKKGQRFALYNSNDGIKVFLGIHDLRNVLSNYEGGKVLRSKTSFTPQEYGIVQAVIHPNYDDALYDVALLRTHEDVVFRPFHVRPICLPPGGHFPDIRKDALVAGWGSLKNNACHTNPNGPAPNSKCIFPFVHNGVVFHNCFFGPNPSSDDPLCKSLRQRRPKELTNYRDEVVLLPKHDFIKNESLTRKCYNPGSGGHGWCATCTLKVNDSSKRLCGEEEMWEPATVDAPDENWGWCNEMCDENRAVLPFQMREVPLVVFEPEKCAHLLNATETFFGTDLELCAGNVQRRERKYMDYTKEKESQFKFDKILNATSATHYELIGGKDACTGDSGAPLWVEVGRRTSRRRRSIIIGVVSRGLNCASNNAPGIYMRVKKVLKWIEKTARGGNCINSTSLSTD